MTEKKRIAGSLLGVLNHPVAIAALDRTIDIEKSAEVAVNFWGYDLFNRKPGPVYNEYGIFEGVNLDLVCFLYELSGRGAIINLPQYKSMRQKKIREDQKIISKENRHGKIIGVQANKDFWSFSVTIIDQNVIGPDQVGYFRTFTLTDLDGNWYDGWNKIEFVPTLNENKFITENKLWTGNQIVFKYMIHPNRWVSFFGHYYVLSKIVIDRLVDESKFLNTQVKSMIEKGINFPEKEGKESYQYEYGETKSIKATAFEAKVYIPERKITGEYPVPKYNQESLVEAYQKRKRLQRMLKKLRFMTRTTEYAHAQAKDNLPGWISGTKWEPGFKIPRKRIVWERLPLFQDKVGEYSIALLRRWYPKSARVDITYKED